MTPVLQVGNRTVTADEIVPLLLRHQLLPQFCREILIDQVIAAIDCDETESAPLRQQFYEAQGITGEREQQAWLKQTSMKLSDLEALAIRPLRIKKFKQQTWGSKLEGLFLSRKLQLDQLVYSLIRTADPEVAQELYFRIQAGEQSFAELARDYSQGPEAETNGLLGPVPVSQPHPGIADKLIHSQPGQLLPPTRMGDWCVILRLENRIPAQLDDSTRQMLLDELFDAWLTEQLSQPQPMSSPSPPLAA
jgi:parvulin-like peptidyl-prolyl isomerase